ncbi:g10723 [Coccomyxa elongata]
MTDSSKFLLGVGVGAAAAVTLTVAAQRFWRKSQPGKLQWKQSINVKAEQDRQRPNAASSSHSLDDDIVAEHFTRNVQFFGRNAQERIMGSFVVVVGLGGVGSHAAHLLLRSGVGRLRLIDFDQVSLSSLNRHAVATRADVGMPKATCLQEHFRQLVPEASVEACVQMYTAEDEDALLDGAPDYVIDAIDNIDTKVALLAACKRRSLPVICVAGAGAKADPTRIRIADVSESNVDPLARAVRQRLRRDHGIDAGVPVVLSTEKPRCALVPISKVGENPLDYQIVPNFRVRTIPVLGTLPAAFGLAAASHVLCELAAAPFAPEPVFRLLETQYATQLQRLTEREDLIYRNSEGHAVDLDDVIYLLREVWRGLSAKGPPHVLGGGDKGFKRSLTNLTLTRWDKDRPPTVDNLVLLTFEEAEQHEGMALEDVRAADPAFYQRVQDTLARIRYELGDTTAHKT